MDFPSDDLLPLAELAPLEAELEPAMVEDEAAARGTLRHVHPQATPSHNERVTKP